MFEIGRRTFVHRVHAGRVTVAEYRHAAELVEVGQETGGVGIGQVVVRVGLRQQGLFRTAHRDVKHLVHVDLVLNTGVGLRVVEQGTVYPDAVPPPFVSA